LGERGREWGRAEGERIFKLTLPLSTEPDSGLDYTTHKIVFSNLCFV